VGLRADPLSACSFVDEAVASAESIRTSNYYLLASGFLGLICILLAFHRRRWVLSLIVIILALAFHPSWMISPMHGPDCSYPNVEASQAVLALIVVLLGYHLWKVVDARRRLSLRD
jgi:hypothetical protein